MNFVEIMAFWKNVAFFWDTLYALHILYSAEIIVPYLNVVPLLFILTPHLGMHSTVKILQVFLWGR